MRELLSRVAVVVRLLLEPLDLVVESRGRDGQLEVEVPQGHSMARCRLTCWPGRPSLGGEALWQVD